jgi:hypothetical protein
MPTANYQLGGKRIPGTTTIIGRFKESGGLIHWAWDLGMQGINYREQRDAAASTGNLGHAMIEAEIKDCTLSDLGIELGIYTPDQQEQAEKCRDSYVKWAKQNSMEIVGTEMNMVSKDLKFGGTPDAVAVLDGKLTLLDFKTSNKTYGDYAVQCAAYCHLVQDGYLFDTEDPNNVIDSPWKGREMDGAHLLRIGKEFGEFHHAYWDAKVMDYCLNAFKNMRCLYDQVAKIKKLA